MARLGMTILALLAFMVVLRESTPKGCCTSYNEKPFPVKLLEKFKKQGVQGTCNINAAIFTTKLGKKICANSNDKWVQRAIEVIKIKKNAYLHNDVGHEQNHDLILS